MVKLVPVDDEETGSISLSRLMPSTGGDILSSLGSGIRGGVEGMLGMAGDLNQMGGQGAAWLAQKLGASPETAGTIGSVARRMSVFGGAPGSEQVSKDADTLMGDALKHDPQTTPGKYAKTVGEFLPAAAAGPGGIARRIATQAVLPAIGSETAGQATEGTAAEPHARVAGALAGGLAPGALRRMISPLPISAERQGMVNTLRKEGVDLTAGQATGRKSLLYAESELGGNAGANLMERQGEQFTAAALKRAGETANRATPEVVDKAFSRIGQQFDDLAARNNVIPDKKLVDDLRSAATAYAESIGAGAKAPIVENTVKDIIAPFQKAGVLPGERYKELSTRVRAAARSTSSPELREAMHGLREAMDSAMERSILKTNPHDATAWRKARREYKNMLVLEKAATGAGENAAQGLISPSHLRNATVQQGRRAYARGKGDFADLARAGEGLMKPLPQSGTAPRTAVRNAGMGLSAIAGSGLGGGMGGAPGAVAGLLAGTVAPMAIGRALMSQPVRSYLSNQVATGMPGVDPRLAALIAALGTQPQAGLPVPQ